MGHMMNFTTYGTNDDFYYIWDIRRWDICRWDMCRWDIRRWDECSDPLFYLSSQSQDQRMKKLQMRIKLD